MSNFLKLYSGDVAWVKEFTDLEYEDNMLSVNKVRDLLRGEDYVKSMGESYLKKPNPRWDNALYDTYKSMAVFKNYTKTIQDVYTGLVFEKTPMIELPESISYLKNDITATNLSIEAFSQKAFREGFTMGRGAAVVDWDEKTERVYVRFYPTEDILSFERDEDGKLKYIAVVDYKKVKKSRFEANVEATVSAFELKDGVCYVTKYKSLTEFSEIKLERRGKALDFIPVAILGAVVNDLEYIQPPMLGVCNLNLHHYRCFAQLEWARAWAANPTPVLIGVSKETFDEMDVKFGPSEVILLENKDSKLEWVELTATSLPSLVESVKEKELLIAKESAAFLMDQKREAETTGTAKLRDKGNKSSVQVLIKNVTDFIYDTLNIAYFWEVGSFYNEGGKDVMTFEINSDLNERSLEPATITALVSMRQSNLISADTFYDNLRSGGLMRSDKPTEDELKAIGEQKIEPVIKPNTTQNTPTV